MLRQNKEVRYLIAVLFHLFHYSKSIRTNDVILFLSLFLSFLGQYIKKHNIFKNQIRQFLTVNRKKLSKKKKKHLTQDGKLVAKIKAL